MYAVDDVKYVDEMAESLRVAVGTRPLHMLRGETNPTWTTRMA
jgi:hypothetical protein